MTTTTAAPRYVSMFLMTSECMSLLSLGLMLTGFHQSWVCIRFRDAGLDFEHDSSTTRQASRGDRHHQCPRKYRQHPGLVHLPRQVRALLCEIVWRGGGDSRYGLRLCFSPAHVSPISQQGAGPEGVGVCDKCAEHIFGAGQCEPDDAALPVSILEVEWEDRPDCDHLAGVSRGRLLLYTNMHTHHLRFFRSFFLQRLI
jgi:hypothetical protein